MKVFCESCGVMWGSMKAFEEDVIKPRGLSKHHTASEQRIVTSRFIMAEPYQGELGEGWRTLRPDPNNRPLYSIVTYYL